MGMEAVQVLCVRVTAEVIAYPLEVCRMLSLFVLVGFGEGPRSLSQVP